MVAIGYNPLKPIITKPNPNHPKFTCIVMTLWVVGSLSQFLIPQKMNAENSEALFPVSLSLSFSVHN